MRILKLVSVFGAALVAALSWAGTLTVTSPTTGASLGSEDSPFLGQTNTLRFNVTGASVEVTVRAEITGPDGRTTSTLDRFTPNFEGRLTGSLPLNFLESAPQGNYTIVVKATEPGNTYTDQTLFVKVDTRRPKILEFDPLRDAFVKGTVPIRATLQETNLESWEVKVGAQVLQTGTTAEVIADWNTDGLIEDGNQTIVITVKDRANNVATQSISVTVDRVAPIITVQFPRSDTTIRPGSLISVVVDVRDRSLASLNVQAVDVIMTRMDGTYIGRVARTSFTAAGADVGRWTGRIRSQRNVAGQFKLVVSAVDRAGNVAGTQTVIVTVR